MYPYYQADLEAGRMTREQAQELIDCVWVKLNDLNKCRDAESAKGICWLQPVPEPDCGRPRTRRGWM